MDIDSDVIERTVEKFCSTRILPYSDAIDFNNSFPNELWVEMGNMGLLGITAPIEFGGIGSNYSTHAKIMQQISYASASIGLSYAAHSNLCVNQIAVHASKKLQDKCLSDLINGNAIGALAMSEPHSGSDALSMKLTARLENNHYILNGEKCWTTNGPDANWIIVYAKTDPNLGSKGITAFVVPTESPGLIRSDKLDKLGMRGSNTCNLTFQNVKVSPENILGNLNEGISILMTGLDYERLILSAGPVGIQKRVLDLVIDYANTRIQFGKPISHFQLIQGKIADIYTRYRSSQSFLEQVCKQADNGTLNQTEAASLYLCCSEAAVQSTLDGIQIFGGNGYTNEYPMGRLFRDAKLYDIGGGTTEIRRMIVARNLCK